MNCERKLQRSQFLILGLLVIHQQASALVFLYPVPVTF